MTATEPASRWSTRRWLYSFLAVFALQAGLVWFLGESAPSPNPPPVNRTPLHLVVDPWSSQQLSTWPGLADPTLFALPNQHGFSGPAWLTFAPVKYELADWTEPPRCLELKDISLAEAFPRMVRTNTWEPLQVADQPMPRSLIPDFAGLNMLAPAQSQCRIEGELAQREWLGKPTLPSWTRTEFLTNSIVQVLADEEGVPFSTRLLGSSGLPEADQYALDLVRQARFAPLSKKKPATLPKTFSWGTMTFYWHCVLPSPTNMPVEVP